MTIPLQQSLATLQTTKNVVAERRIVVRGQMPATDTLVYTAPTPSPLAGSTVLRSITLSNTDSSARTATVYLVELGGSVAANRAILSAEPLAAAGTATCNYQKEWTGGLTLPAGEKIYVKASVASVVNYRLDIQERQ